MLSRTVSGCGTGDLLGGLVSEVLRMEWEGWRTRGRVAPAHLNFAVHLRWHVFMEDEATVLDILRSVSTRAVNVEEPKTGDSFDCSSGYSTSADQRVKFLGNKD